MGMKLTDELEWRGFSNQTTYKDINVLNNSKINFYLGVDPSSDSLQIGNLAVIMMVKCFIKHGHNAVLLVGGATGLIGDPDGKTDERSLKSTDEINRNKQAISQQYEQLIGKNNFKLVDNYSWFKNINYLDFLRDVGKNVPMRQMLSRDFVQNRLSEDGAGISYAEFSYVLIQAYDFLQLFENENVTLQICGSDQWGNSIAGVDLIRRKNGGTGNVYSAPLVTDKTTGRKFGKSEDGAIWLDSKKTTPTKFYQFWVNLDDDSVKDYLKLFTEKDITWVEDIIKRHSDNTGIRIAQKSLAFEVTKIVHGEDSAISAQSVTDYLVGHKQISEASEADIEAIRHEIPSYKVINNSPIYEAMVKSGLASSNSEARRLIDSNAVSINGDKIQRDNFESNDFKNGRLILRRGKAFKDSALIELT